MTNTTTCARCGDNLTWVDHVSEVPGEWHHEHAADDNDLARCPDGEYGYPAPLRHVDGIHLNMGERNLIVSALGYMLQETTTALARESTEEGREIIRDAYGDPQAIRDVRDHITYGDKGA